MDSCSQVNGGLLSFTGLYAFRLSVHEMKPEETLSIYGPLHTYPVLANESRYDIGILYL